MILIFTDFYFAILAITTQDVIASLIATFIWSVILSPIAIKVFKPIAIKVFNIIKGMQPGEKLQFYATIGCIILLLTMQCNSSVRTNDEGTQDVSTESSYKVPQIETDKENTTSDKKTYEQNGIKDETLEHVNENNIVSNKDITKKRLFVYLIDESISFNPNPKDKGQMDRNAYTVGTKKIILFDAAFEHLIEHIDKNITYGDEVDIIKIISKNNDRISSIDNFSFANKSFVFTEPRPEGNTLALAKWRQRKEKFEEDIKPKFDKKKKYYIDLLREYKKERLGVGTWNTDLWGSIRDASQTLIDDSFVEKHLILYSDLTDSVDKKSKGTNEIKFKNVNVSCLFFHNEDNSVNFRLDRIKEIQDKTGADNVLIKTVKQSLAEIENIENVKRY